MMDKLKVLTGNIFKKNIFSKNIFSKNIFGDSENIFGENILGENFFGQNIFGPPITLPCPTYNHHLFTPPSSVIFKDECYGRTKDELTDRTHTRIVSFIVLDINKWIKINTEESMSIVPVGNKVCCCRNGRVTSTI